MRKSGSGLFVKVLIPYFLIKERSKCEEVGERAKKRGLS